MNKYKNTKNDTKMSKNYISYKNVYVLYHTKK